MVKANFTTYGSCVTDSIYQWEIDRVLQVTGLSLTVKPEVHFSNAALGLAVPRQADMVGGVVRVGIPNSLLQYPLPIYAHIGIYDGSTFKVIQVVEIPVKRRARPADYQIENRDEELYSFNRLENKLNNINDEWIAMNAEQVQATVTSWLDAHPEATTTVQAGSLTLDKFVVGAMGYVTPEMYGAKGDGVTDDTAALQSAIDSGWPVRIPEGSYNVTADLVVSSHDVTVDGPGAVLKMNGHNLVVAGASSSAVVRGFKLRGVELSGGSLHLKFLNDYTIENCYFHNGTHGAVGSHCYNGAVFGCTFSDCEVGLIFDKDILAPGATADHNAIAVRSCKFYNNTDAAFIIRGGFVGEFSFNSVEGNARGVVIEGMADYRLLSNYFEYNKGDIITLNNYNGAVNSSITIGGNRIFGDATSTLTGMVLTGNVMGLVLQCNSWGGLGTLIKNSAILSGPVLLYQINNTGKSFPDFINNLAPLGKGLIVNSVSAEPDVITGRLYTKDSQVCAQTKLGDYVLNYKLGYVPALNKTPSAGEGLLYTLPDGRLCIKINGVEKTVSLT